MRPVRAERGGQFRRQLHSLRFQFLERLRHRMAVVGNHQVGNQMIVFDDFQLILSHIFRFCRSKVEMIDLVDAN